MAGYLPDSATAEAFSDGWYRTGDVGYLDVDGWLRITDRAKEMIKVRGFQVAPAEIEAVLHGHPSVEDCAVFGVPDRGERGGRRRRRQVMRCRGCRRTDRAGRGSAGVLQAAEPSGVRRRNPAPAIGKGVAPSVEGASVDVRLTSEQQQLREAAAKLADDLGPGSVADLDDEIRVARLEKAVDATGFRTLRIRRRIRCRGGHRRRGVRARPGRRAVPRTGARRRPEAVARSRAVGPERGARVRRPDENCCRSGRIAARSWMSFPTRTRAAGMRWHWPSPAPTWSAPRAAHTRWLVSTPRCASSTARRSGPIRPSGTCWPRAWP